MWRIYYSDHHVDGETADDWQRAPDQDVQVVVLFEPTEHPRWHNRKGPITDRQLWTGDDEFDPFGWGVKYGEWMDWERYQDLWEAACADARP